MVAKKISLILTVDELVLICNAFNEVLNGVDISEDEFETRLGMNKKDAQCVYARLAKKLDSD